MELTKVSETGHWVDMTRINKDSVIVDAGSCIGEFVDDIRKLVKCRIIAIEPNHDNVLVLKEKFVEIIEAGLVGRLMPENAVFYHYLRRERGNLFNLYPGSNDKYDIKTITLDGLFKKCKRIDYFKVDIEGCEKDLVETMTKEDADKIDQVSIEYHLNYSKNKLMQKLTELGYKVQSLPIKEVYGSK